MANSTLHVASNNFRTYEVLVAAKYGDSHVQVQYDQHADKKSSFGKLPNLHCKDGKTLTGSHAIAKFLAQKSLSASSTCETTSAEILQWFDLVDNDVVPNALAWLLPSVSALPHTKNADDAKTETLRLLNTLNEYLSARTFLVGERLSLADVATSCALLPLYQHLLEPETRKKLVHLTRWFVTCVNQPNFKAVVGDVPLCTKACQFDNTKYQAFAKSAPAAHAHEAKPEKTQKKESKKEEKKPKEKKAAEPQPAAEQPEEMDATEEALAQESKQKDPFAEMPKGTFNMEEFKRVYSNEDTLTKALPYFWDQFDPSAFSIWYCEYKYADELTLCFMSCNLISGMFQRLDKLRKNAFGSVCLFGTDNNSTISGIWAWRGQDLVFELCDDWKVDYESYEWKKLDPNSPATKQMVQEYFSWEGNFDGKKFNQGKIFK